MSPASIVMSRGTAACLCVALLGVLLAAPAQGSGTRGSIRHYSEGVDPGSRPYQKKALSPSDPSLQHREQNVDPGSRPYEKPALRPSDPSLQHREQNVDPGSRPYDRAALNPSDPSLQHREQNVDPMSRPYQAKDPNDWYGQRGSGSMRHSDQLWEPKSDTQRYIQDTFMGGRQRRAQPELTEREPVQPQVGRDVQHYTEEDRKSTWDKIDDTFDDAQYYKGRYTDPPPRTGRVLQEAPAGAEKVKVSGADYTTYDGTYYQQTPKGYEVVAAPRGAVVAAPPMGYETVRAGEQTYFYYHGTYYTMRPGGEDYAVVNPAPGAEVPYLPKGRTTTHVDGKVRYIYDGVTYSPVYKNGALVYQVVGN